MKSWLPIGLLAVGAIGGIFVCRWIWDCPECSCDDCPVPADATVVVGLEQGCPDDWDSVRVVYKEDRKSVSIGGELGIAESALGLNPAGKLAQHNIPEYHDCQRFLARDADPGAPFDSLFAVFALEPESLVDRLKDNDRRPVLAAQIWSRNGSWEDLGIEPWFNCLYLWRGDGNWEAAVLPSGRDAQKCAVKLDDFPSAQGLHVLHSTPSDSLADYPLAARWEWNPTPPGYRIGIQCGPAWCEITRTGETATPDAEQVALQKGFNGIGAEGGVWSGDQLTRAKVKGWYDEQILDVYTDGRLVSSGIRGFVFPDTGIAKHTTEAPYEDAWILSTYVYLDPLYEDVDAGFEKYAAMFNFGRTDWMNPNKVWFCKPDSRGCGVQNPQILKDCQQEVGPDTWLAKIFNAETRTEDYRCVARCDHSPGFVPGTARWRGVEYDAKMWSRCAEGCCTIQ